MERDDSDDQSIDVMCDLFTSQRRRYVLRSLTDTTQPIALADLAEDVAVRENEKPLVEIPKEEVRAIRTSLYHVHVPKLADAGAVDYDRNRNLVRVDDSADVVERVLSLCADGGTER